MLNLNRFNKKKLVSTKGIVCLNFKINVSIWFNLKKFFVKEKKFKFILNDIVNAKNCNLTCSCEKVLLAMGVFKKVILYCIVGLKTNEGVIRFFELWFVLIYQNHVKIRYDCFTNNFLKRLLKLFNEFWKIKRMCVIL